MNKEVVQGIREKVVGSWRAPAESKHAGVKNVCSSQFSTGVRPMFLDSKFFPTVSIGK
jgi:hypothetical protein